MASPVRVPSAGYAGPEIIEVEFPADLERQLLSALDESQGAAVVAADRKWDEGAGDGHRFWPTRALRYSP